VGQGLALPALAGRVVVQVGRAPFPPSEAPSNGASR